jgi:uroporphyrinogen decarboxylase
MNVMTELTGKERISRILRHQPVDRIGLFEHFWGDTQKEWVENQGCGSDLNKEFNFDLVECWPFKMVARVDFEPVVIKEDEDTVTKLDGNWAVLRRHKKHDSTPEHVRYEIDSREKWEERVKPLLLDRSLFEKRINFEAYRKDKKYAADNNKYFIWSGVNVFECMHPVAGHEEMLAAMIYDPEWVADMSKTFAWLTVELQKMLFEREGKPDGIWYYEDMGYKGAPFMSPAMYDQFIYPSHVYTFDFAHSLGLPVMVHSCGFVEPLLPGMIKAGMDLLEAMEVKAGMDLLRIYQNYGDKIALMGGIDARALCSNDRTQIDAELEKKIPTVKGKYGYVLHTDHSVPKTVDLENYRYFIKKGLELGTY